MKCSNWQRLYPLLHQPSVSNCIWHPLELRNILRNQCENLTLEILVTLPLLRWALPQKGNVTSELWPKFFQYRSFITHLHSEKLFAAALKCLGPPFTDTICLAEPLFPILFWVQSLIQSSVFIVSQPCVMSLKKQRPQEEPEDFGFSAIIQSFRWQCSKASRLWQEFLWKHRREQNQTNKEIWFPREELFKRSQCGVTYFTRGARYHQVISLEIIQQGLNPYFKLDIVFVLFIWMHTRPCLLYFWKVFS